MNPGFIHCQTIPLWFSFKAETSRKIQLQQTKIPVKPGFLFAVIY